MSEGTAEGIYGVTAVALVGLAPAEGFAIVKNPYSEAQSAVGEGLTALVQR